MLLNKNERTGLRLFRQHNCHWFRSDYIYYNVISRITDTYKWCKLDTIRQRKLNVLPQQMREIPMALSPKLGTATPKAVKLSGLAVVPQRPTSRWHCSPSCGVQKVPENREKWNSIHPWTNSQLLTEGNRGLYTLIDPYIEKKPIIHWRLDELSLMINKASFFSFPARLRNQTQKKCIFERTTGIASNWLWLRSHHRSVYWAMPV